MKAMPSMQGTVLIHMLNTIFGKFLHSSPVTYALVVHSLFMSGLSLCNTIVLVQGAQG